MARDFGNEAAEHLAAAEHNAEGPRSQALVGIGLGLLALVDEIRVHTLIGYLQVLISDPKPDAETVARARALEQTIAARLGLTVEEEQP